MNRLLDRLACLESINDQLSSELQYVDHLLREIGFVEGLDSVKKAAEELVEEQHPEIQEE